MSIPPTGWQNRCFVVCAAAPDTNSASAAKIETALVLVNRMISSRKGARGPDTLCPSSVSAEFHDRLAHAMEKFLAPGAIARGESRHNISLFNRLTLFQVGDIV
jgi:hypothetical protein